MKTGKPELLGEMNKTLILDYLRKNGPKSRADIKRELGFSFPTVSTNVRDLIDSRMILETGVSDNGIGRKATMLEFNANIGYVLGIDVGRTTIRMMICDLSGGVLISTVSEQATKQTVQGILEQIEAEIERILEGAGIQREALLYISIGIPGIVDKKEGKHRLAPFMVPFHDVRLDLYLQEKYGIPAICSNSVDFGAIGEKWKGAGREYKNIIYINYGIGIGCALILNGELFTGANGAAGEAGFMLPDIRMQRDTFEEEGVMEQRIGGRELEQRMRQRNGLPYSDIKELLLHADEPDFPGTDFVEEIKRQVGLMLVNLVSVINPEIVIFGGGIGKQLAIRFRAYFQDFMAAHVPYVPLLVPSMLDEKANLLGAVAFALRNLHQDYASLGINSTRRE